MAGKLTGLGITVTIDNSAGAGKDISDDINDITWDTSRGTVDVTGLDKLGVERQQLLADAKITIKGSINLDTDRSHSIFKDVTTTSVHRTVVITLSTATLTMEILFSSYGVARDAAGKLGFTATGDNADGTVPTWS